MLSRSPTQPNANALHEASYIEQARAIGVTLRPPRLDLIRRMFGGVVDLSTDDGSAEFCANAARIMCAGDAILALMAPDARGNTRDLMEASDALYLSFRRRKAGNLHNPSIYNEFHATKTEMQFQAATFVREHQAEILKTAADLAATAPK
jgi:hypothetical protein